MPRFLPRLKQNISAELRRPYQATASFLNRFRRRDDGAAAVEMALIAVPFFGLLFGIIGVGLYFFTVFSIENAVERASRLIRTGQAQVAEMTTSDFKDEVCKYTPAFVDCTSKVRVNVAVFSSFGTLEPARCTDDGGDLIPEPPAGALPGQAGEIVLVTVCYQWDAAGYLPFVTVGNMDGGAALIRASTTFRTEPFGTTTQGN